MHVDSINTNTASDNKIHSDTNIITNVEYEWYSKDSFPSNRKWNELCNSVRQSTTTICGKCISINFLKDAFKSADFLLVAYAQKTSYLMRTTTKMYRTPVGVVAMHVLTDSNNKGHVLQPNDVVLYMDMLCSSIAGLGSKLLNIVEDYAKQNYYTKLQLSALPYVINYYRKFGFMFSHKQEEFPAITKMYLRYPQLSTLKFTSDEEAKTDKLFTKLMEKLKDNGFAHDLGSSNLEEASEDGFVMSKHLLA